MVSLSLTSLMTLVTPNMFRKLTIDTCQRFRKLKSDMLGLPFKHLKEIAEIMNVWFIVVMTFKLRCIFFIRSPCKYIDLGKKHG